jgi:hypothetical protein
MVMSQIDKDADFIREQIRLGDEAAARARADPKFRQTVGEALWEAYVQIENDEHFCAWVRRHFAGQMSVKQAREYMQIVMSAGYRPPQKSGPMK